MADENFFIVIEGLDGAGKTSVARELADVLRQTRGDDVLLTQEPHDDCLAGEDIRAALAGTLQIGPAALALAFALNRLSHVERVVDPFLRSAGRVVISDRYLLSSLVYQSAGGLDMDNVYSLNRWARQPDLTIHLKIKAHQAYARMRQRLKARDLYENNLQARGHKYQEGIALLREKGETIVEVDAEAAFSQVFADVLAAVQAGAPGWLRIQPPLLFGDAVG